MRCEQSSASDQEDSIRQLMGLVDGNRRSAMNMKKDISESEDDDTSVAGMANNGKDLFRNMVRDNSEYDNIQFSVESEAKSPKARRRHLKDYDDSGVSIYDSGDVELVSREGNVKKQGSKGASRRGNEVRDRWNKKRQEQNEDIESDDNENIGISRPKKANSRGNSTSHHSSGTHRFGKSVPEGSLKYPRSSFHSGSSRANPGKYSTKDHGRRTGKGGLSKHTSHENAESTENSGIKESDEESSSRFIDKLEGQMRKGALRTRSR